MTDLPTSPESDEEAQDDILAIYGRPESYPVDLAQAVEQRRSFRPWHHPVKQIVRVRQWAALTKRLLETRPHGNPRFLRYFTLPGPDLLDVRVLADVCDPLGIRIEYFGFDAGTSNPADDADLAEDQSADANWVTAESSLLQAGRITPDAVIYTDRLEDIAVPDSHAAMQLRQRPAFDVVNIDACDHLAYAPKGRTRNTFDALNALLQHQMGAKSPWLLFITTRAVPSLLGQPGIQFQAAITQNLCVPQGTFGASLAACLDVDESKLAAELNSIWGKQDARFLKLYSVGLGKFLLQFFHAQPNLPANVELASIYAYRVHCEEPDMLALAFRITPDAPRVFPPNVGGAVAVPALEPARATKVATQARKLRTELRLVATKRKTSTIIEVDCGLSRLPSCRHCILHRTRNTLPNWRRHRIRDLLDLLRQISLQDKTRRKSLQKHRFVYAQSPSSIWVNVNFPMPKCNSWTGHIPSQSFKTTTITVLAIRSLKARRLGLHRPMIFVNWNICRLKISIKKLWSRQIPDSLSDRL